MATASLDLSHTVYHEGTFHHYVHPVTLEDGTVIGVIYAKSTGYALLDHTKPGEVYHTPESLAQFPADSEIFDPHEAQGMDEFRLLIRGGVFDEEDDYADIEGMQEEEQVEIVGIYNLLVEEHPRHFIPQEDDEDEEDWED